MSVSTVSSTRVNGRRLKPGDTVARVTLRPIGSPLPLAAFTLVPAGLLLAGVQLGWFSDRPRERSHAHQSRTGGVLPGLRRAVRNAHRAAGIVGLLFVAIACYVGLATLLEANAYKSILPIGRRARARAAIDVGLDAQLVELEHEAGVREQL